MQRYAFFFETANFFEKKLKKTCTYQKKAVSLRRLSEKMYIWKSEICHLDNYLTRVLVSLEYRLHTLSRVLISLEFLPLLALTPTS